MNRRKKSANHTGSTFWKELSNMESKKISAVVLAGGFGTRLAPLTDSRPKPLMKILGKSVLDIAMEKLESLGMSDISVSAHYKWQSVERCISKYKNARLVLEETPMGTAGGVKKCCENSGETVLVLSGDGVFDFDLEKILLFHNVSKADVTIVSRRWDNPTSFGVVLCDEKGKVYGLDEKPPWKKVVSDTVNTGIYVLSKRAVDAIPKDKVYDFSKDLFPRLIKEGYDVRTVVCDGYWCDIGSFDDYLGCNIDACRGQVLSVKPDENLSEKLKKVGIDARDSVYIGENAVIGSNVVFDDGFVCGDDCTVEKDCTVSGSVLGDGVCIGKGSSLSGVIIGDGVKVGENCILEKGCVIADGCVIKEGTVLEKNTSVYCDGRMIKNNFTKDGESMFVDDGTAVCREDDVGNFARSLCLSIEDGKKQISICLICEDCKLRQSFIEGSGGNVTVLELSDADSSLAAFASVYYPADVTAVVERMGEKAEIVLFTPSGEKISDSLERKISKQYSVSCRIKESEEFEKCRVLKIDGASQIYALAAKQGIKNMLCGLPCFDFDVSFDGEDDERKKALSAVISQFCTHSDNGRNNKLTVKFDNEGFTVRDNGTQMDFHHSLCALYSPQTVDIGLSQAYINENQPFSFEREAKKTGADCKNIFSVTSALLEAKLLDFLVCREAGFCLCALLCLMAVSGKRIKEIKEGLSAFEIYTDTYYGEKSRAHSMERLCSLYGSAERRENGVSVKTSSGTVTVIPGRVRGFKIISEAASFEAAKELCDRMGKAVVSENFEE